MSTSRIPAVLDALVTTFTTSLTSVTVVDGPPTHLIPNRGLYVGATAGDDSIGFAQEWSGQGHLRRKEQMTIPNLLHHRTGNPSTKDARDAIFADLALIEDALRAAPTLGLTGFTTRAQFGTAGNYSQTREGKGLIVRVAFSIFVEVRI